MLRYNITFPSVRSEFEALTAVSINIMVSWNVTPCNLVHKSKRLRHTCCLHFKSSRVSQAGIVFINIEKERWGVEISTQ
jgi:hypothetical protein